MGDFRSSAWTLADALADDYVLDALEARPMHEANARAQKVVDVVTNPDAKRTAGGLLLHEGFRYVGTCSERVKRSMPRTPCDTFVALDHSTYVMVRRRTWSRALSKYYIVTHFDDGSCIQSVSRTNPILSSEGPLMVRAGHDDLVRDVAEHLNVVRERARQGTRIIPVKTLADVVRIVRFHYGHVASPTTADAIEKVPANQRVVLKAIAMWIPILIGITILFSRRC